MANGKMPFWFWLLLPPFAIPVPYTAWQHLFLTDGGLHPSIGRSPCHGVLPALPSAIRTSLGKLQVPGWKEYALPVNYIHKFG